MTGIALDYIENRRSQLMRHATKLDEFAHKPWVLGGLYSNFSMMVVAVADVELGEDEGIVDR